ncbi:MAG: hypothetical protein AB1345_08960 [Chloroflexota bacterium]
MSSGLFMKITENFFPHLSTGFFQIISFGFEPEQTLTGSSGDRCQVIFKRIRHAFYCIQQQVTPPSNSANVIGIIHKIADVYSFYAEIMFRHLTSLLF